MSRPTLPNELLCDIFSQLSSSKSTLFHISLASRTFCYIAKPFLYSYIKITTRECRERLKRVRKEDARLVKKLVIDGRKASFENGVGSSETESGHECLVELFRGEFLDISTLEILHVVGVRQKELILDLELEEIKPAMNLVELSMEEYGIETHFKGDDKEEENEKDSISLIPRSFVDFVKRQKEKEEMNEMEEE
ncbi:F-box protein [Sporobolomyces salmoneus]|uniref:F-box protein n=1 Tax=Sporobolomyces salmoneus TaxID=183962 RepID=UPI00318114BC